jgi:uncharacterized membrane protein YeaQ/YmgE (transglycosylase-associated protein family)
MELIITGVIAGVLGTLVMDLLNHFFARHGLISKIDVATIGRMAAGWMQGRLCYEHPGEMKQIENEVFYGYISHYTIGISLALPFVFGWNLLAGGPASPIWALIYGVGTMVASWFFVYPSIGFGVFGWKSPDGIKAALSSLANHLFYGIGFAVSIALV